MSLAEAQCKYLRGLGHALRPVVLVGSTGITDSLLDELNQTLEHHELIKVRIRAGDRNRRDALLHQLTTRSKAELVQRIGNVALLYRRAQEPRLVLP